MTARFFDDAKESEIVCMFNAGECCADIARHFECGRHVVNNALRRHGITPSLLQRYGRKPDAELDRRIIECYETGKSIRKTAKICGVTPTWCRGRIEKHGKLRHDVGPRILTEEMSAKVIELYKKGWTQLRIGKELKICRKSIKKTLFLAELPIRIQKGSDSTQYKGGICKNSGYVYIQLPPYHEYFGMTNKSMYVGEHRLIMAQHLGRPLDRRESVHHKNGIRDDNRIDNLQLRQGSHGKGQKYKCADCGSCNVIPVELD